MSIWFILAYLAVGYGVMLGVAFGGLWLYERCEARARIRERLNQAARTP
jgi:hypothetical protein